VLDDRELLELESDSDSGTAGSNRRGIPTPSESFDSETVRVGACGSMDFAWTGVALIMYFQTLYHVTCA
jgi:hypothetical protein